jgi:hypothetical protein
MSAGKKALVIRIHSLKSYTRRTIEAVDDLNTNSSKPPRAAAASDVAKVYSSMTNSGPLGFLRRLSLHQKILIWGLIKEGKRRRVVGEDVEVGDVSLPHHPYTLIDVLSRSSGFI